MPNLEGRTLVGQYEIIERIGSGGMAEVYKAFDRSRRYHVAIKVLREELAEDRHVLEYLQKESDTQSQLAHNNIVRFYEYGEEGERAFLVMDFVDGITLRHLISRRQGPLSLTETLHILEQVCRGLEFAHDKGFVHRDIKPSNIMLRKSDGVALITDFGIAKVVEEQAVSSTILLGVPGYMSPEQIKGERMDSRSDIYSLGITAYEMVTGRRPFVGDTDKATGSAQEKVRWQQINQVPARPTELNPELAPSIDQVILKALEKDRDKRQSTAMEFLGEFKSAGLSAGVEPKKIEIEIAERKPVRKKEDAREAIPSKALIPIAASAILVTILIGLFALGKILPLVIPQAFAAQTPTISVGATSTALAWANATTNAQAIATANAQATAEAQTVATAQAQATAEAQTAATVQAETTKQAQAMATLRAGGTTTAQAQAAATSQAAVVPNPTNPIDLVVRVSPAFIRDQPNSRGSIVAEANEGDHFSGNCRSQGDNYGILEWYVKVGLRDEKTGWLLLKQTDKQYQLTLFAPCQS